MTTYKVKVGSLKLTEARDVSIPQEFAAWHQTVRVEPGAYDVYAYLEWTCDGGGMHRLRQLSALAEGITISSNFRSHVWGHWGDSDNNKNGQRATVAIDLPTYGLVNEAIGLLGQATLDDTLVREEWDPADNDARHVRRAEDRMWHFNVKPGLSMVIVESAQESYALTKLATVVK